MASSQANALLTKSVLQPGEDHMASSLLRSQRSSGGGDNNANKLIQRADLLGGYNKIPGFKTGRKLATAFTVPEGSLENKASQFIGNMSNGTSPRGNRGLGVSSSGKLIDYSDEDNSRERTFSSLFRQGRQMAISDQQTKRLAQQTLGVASAGIQQGTGKVLQQAWLNLIDTYGLSLIWINIHVFLRLVFGEQFFGKLGSEWFSTGKMGGAKKAGGGSFLGLGARAIGILEAAVLALLDLIVVLLILISLTLNGLIIYMIINPVDAIWNGLGLEAFVALVRLTFGF